GEVLDLALVELRQELAPEIGERARGPEHALEKGTIGVRAAQPEPRREVGVAPLDRAQEHGEAAPRQLAPREPGARRPGRAAGAESGAETVHRLFREAPIGGDLAAERSEERRVGKECRMRWGTYEQKKENGQQGLQRKA